MTPSPDLVQRLLALPTPAGRAALLRDEAMLEERSLAALLEQAGQFARSQPGASRRLAELFAEESVRAIAPALAPRATYLRAQTHAFNGEFEIARQLIEAARQEFLAQGNEFEALRTNVGLMHVLGEMGRYQEALQAGQAILDAVATGAAPESPNGGQAEMLTALAHQNRGVCFEHIGQYDEAITAYELAEARYQALGIDEHVGHIRNNRGIVLLDLGRASEALAAFESAATIYSRSGSQLLQAQAQINIGNAHLLAGHYSRSLDAFARAEQLLAALDAAAEESILLLDKANAYLALNLYPEAVATYQEAIASLQVSGMLHHRARALWGLGAALAAEGQVEEADGALVEAVVLLEEIENVPLRSSVMLEECALLVARQQPVQARTMAQQVLSNLSAGEWPVQQLYALLRLADLLLPDAEAALPLLLEAQQMGDRLALPHLRYRTYHRLGRLYLLQERQDEAGALLEAALDDIELLRGTLAQEAMRTSFLSDKMAVYEDLVQLYLNRNELQRAFAIVEQAKSRALLDLISGVIEAGAEQVADPEIAARLEQLRADLNAIYNQTAENGDEGERHVPLVAMQARARGLEQEINRLRLAASLVGDGRRGRFDLYASPMSLEAIRAHLPADVILLAYYILDDEVLAFINCDGQLQVVRHLATKGAVEELLQRLSMQWARFRGGPAFVQRNMALLEQSAQRVLSGLYDCLVAPLEALLPIEGGAVAPRLTIVPHGLLHQVPFHALFDGRHYLLERFEISYGPSATILAHAYRQPQADNRKSTRMNADPADSRGSLRREESASIRPIRDDPCAIEAVVMGVSDPLIPAVAAEVRNVAGLLDGAVAYLDEEATLARLWSQVEGCRILHLACHGLFRGDNPLFSAVKLYDGWLSAADVMQLKLDDTLVTLSACESGRGQATAGDEVVGLARAFLGAGAAALVVSLWLVEDQTTAALMGDWYRQLAAQEEKREGSDGGRAGALRAAQLALKATHSHPYYWAPFIFIGRS